MIGYFSVDFLRPLQTESGQAASVRTVLLEQLVYTQPTFRQNTHAGLHVLSECLLYKLII